MKAVETKFLTFLKKFPQFTIPIYQRTYSWTREECEDLWRDILRTGEDGDTTSTASPGRSVAIISGTRWKTG